VLAELEVEGAERLVEQEHGRVEDQRPGERDPLALPAGELIDAAAAEPGQADALEHRVDPARDVGARRAPTSQAIGDVVGDRHHREERQVLEDQVHRAAVRRDAEHRSAADTDVAGARTFEAGDHPEEGRLSTTRRSEDGEERAPGDGERDSADRHDVPEAADDVPHLQVDHQRGLRARRRAGWGSGVSGRSA
jgi:hypothetical protein